MNYKQIIERLRRVMQDYPVGSRKHELAKEAFAAYVAALNKKVVGGK